MSVTKNYLYNVLLIISNTLFPIITFPYVSRVLMPEYLGKVYFVQGVIAYFLLVAVLGAPNYGIKKLAKEKAVGNWPEFKNIFTELFLLTIVSSILAVLFLCGLVFSYEKFSAEKVSFLVFGAQVLFECMHINYFFIVMENHKRRLVRSFMIRILSLFFLFKYIKEPKDYILYALLLVVPEIIARVIDVFSMRKYFNFNFKELSLKRHINEMLIIFMYLFTIGIYGSIDTTMLGMMINDTEVGLYSAAVKMYKMTLPVILTLGTVLSPRIIGAIKKEEKNNLYKNLDIFMDYAFIVGIPATLLLTILAPQLTLLFSGETFRPSIITMQIMSPSLFFLAIGSFCGGQILLPNNKEKTILKISIFGVFLNIILNFILIPNWLRNGAALATLITEILISLIKIYIVKRIYEDYFVMNNDRIKVFFINIFISILIFLGLKNIELDNKLLKITLALSIYGLIYLIFLNLLKVQRIIEWRGIILKKLNKK